MTSAARPGPRLCYDLRMRGALALLCVAACGGSQSSGAFVSVKAGGVAIDTVNLYLGQAPCMKPDATRCGIAPKGLSRRLGGDNSGGVWLRDDSGNEKPFAEPAPKGTAKFQIESPSADETLQIVAVGEHNGTAVAYGVANDVTIPAHGAVQLVITLVAASPLSDMEENVAPHPDGDFVEEWNNPALCVVAEHWSGGVATRTLVVPNEDPDCDGFLAVDSTGQRNMLECDPYYFDFSSPLAKFSASSCAAPNFLVAGFHTCVLGGAPCTDGVGPDVTACAPVTGPTTCIPAGACSAGDCGLPTSTSTFSSCAMSGGGTSGASFVHCIITADSTGPCQATLARPLAGTVDLAKLLGTAMNRSCTNIAFLRTDSLKDIQTTDTVNLTASNANVQLNNPSDPCSIDLQWDGNVLPPSIYMQSPDYGAFKVDFDNGNSTLIPVEFTATSCLNIQPGQTDGISCFVVLGTPNGVADTITTCAI